MKNRSASPAARAVKLWLVGEGPERAASEARARDLGLDARFLGDRDDLPELLAGASAFLLASERESFGLAALEAMAA
ncbi:MAG: glycosyltransferase, partial [Candidatus Puniceispirillaceae bacterium]